MFYRRTATGFRHVHFICCSVGLCLGLGEAVVTKLWSVKRTNLLLQQPRQKEAKYDRCVYHINCKQERQHNGSPRVTVLRDRKFLSKYPKRWRVFPLERNILLAKRKNLVKQGKGHEKLNKPNTSCELTDEEEEKLFESCEFGDKDNFTLQRTCFQ